MISEEFKDFVFLSALENAVSFKGSANPKALIGKCMPKFPEMKQNMKDYMQVLNEIVAEVNNLGFEKQKEKLLNIKPEFFEEKNKKKEPNKTDGLPKLKNTENGVVVRFPPAPSGHLHLGHLFGVIANYEIKKKYEGKFILRFEDTNPENIDISNYEKVSDDVKWLCDGNIDETFYQSDRLEIYYKYLRQLVEMGQAYICKCESDVFKAFNDAKEQCPCAKMDQETQNRKLEKFMNGRYEMGEVVIRARADIENKNPALRTFPLARINDNSHARVGKKYRVWPNYNLACAIDDSLMGLTHVVRGKDLEIGEIRQKMLHTSLGLKSPEYFHYGRMKFTDVELSKTKLSEKIEAGVYSGWDDPRVPSILSHRKRGYRAAAFRKFILSMGISKRDSKISAAEYYKGLDFFNKQILEDESDRYFFVYNPKKVEITNLQDYKDYVCKGVNSNCDEIVINKHPEKKERGFRHISIANEFLISGVDFDGLDEGDLFRLMHFANFRIISKTKDIIKVEFESKEFSRDLKLKRNIHFVPIDGDKITMIMQDNSKLKGIVEDLNNLKEDSTVQFERFGFARFDSFDKDKNRIFYFAHK